jgi:hypothetical protein
MKTYYWINQNRLLSHLRTIFCALTIVAASLTLPSSEAGSPIQSASGQFFPCFTQTSARPVGENLIVTFDITGTSTATTGPFSGSVTGTELDVVHRDGSITLHGSVVFTTADNSGTILLTYEGIGNAVTGHENLRFVGTQGTGSLSGVYAELTAEGDVGGACAGDFGGHGTYSGQIVFAP